MKKTYTAMAMADEDVLEKIGLRGLEDIDKLSEELDSMLGPKPGSDLILASLMSKSLKEEALKEPLSKDAIPTDLTPIVSAENEDPIAMKEKQIVGELGLLFDQFDDFE